MKRSRDLGLRLLAATVLGVAAAGAMADSRLLLRAPGAEVRMDGELRCSGTAEITVTDVLASNGVIHGIDAVLTPPAT